MERIEQMYSAIREARKKYWGKRGGYDLRCVEMEELFKILQTQPFEAIGQTFDYGFTKGVRYAKATYKKGARV